MTNSSSNAAGLAAAAAAAAASAGAGAGAATPRPSPHARFIPREELGAFASWTPGNLGGASTASPYAPTKGQTGAGAQRAGARAPAPPPPAAPTEAEWRARMAEERRQGTQEGYQNGYRDGLVALDSFKQSLAGQGAAQVAAVMQSLDREFDRLQPQLAHAVARVAVELARQVLKSELSHNPQVVVSVAEHAMEALVHSARHITVQAHPQDVALVRAGCVETLAAREARVVPNPTLQRGDCIVESDVGTLDARVATRWAQATANLSASLPWTGVEETATPAAGADVENA